MSNTPQENQPGEAAQDLVGPETQADGTSSETATLRSQIEEEWKASAGKFLLEMMEDACKAARIDPKDYLPDSEGGDERGYDDKQLKMRWMKIAIAADEQLSAERAKRLELEKVLFDARQAIIREGLARDKAEAELLALRGGEVGQQAIQSESAGNVAFKVNPHPLAVGPEAKADGESRPTSAICPHCGAVGATGPCPKEGKRAPGEPSTIDEWKHKYRLRTDQLEHKITTQRIEINRLLRASGVGEGRKVSAGLTRETMEWLKQSCHDGMTVDINSPAYHARELLCVLSEEGGRQKEGGTETK